MPCFVIWRGIQHAEIYITPLAISNSFFSGHCQTLSQAEMAVYTDMYSVISKYY